MTIINGTEYKFYEVLYPDYAVFLATDIQDALSRHAEHLGYGDIKLEECDIREVSYEDVEDLYNSDSHVVNHGYLSSKGVTFKEMLEIAEQDDDKCVLFDYNPTFIVEGGK